VKASVASAVVKHLALIPPIKWIPSAASFPPAPPHSRRRIQSTAVTGSGDGVGMGQGSTSDSGSRSSTAMVDCAERWAR